MSKIGFVYILVNDYMPDVYKVGCTERSPHERAAELSNHTGVPAPFKVLCYAEFADFQSVERKMHEWLAEWRINTGREFFKGRLELAVRMLFWNRQRLSFTTPGAWNEADNAGVLALFSRAFSMDGTLDPWAPAPKAPEPATDPAVAKVVGEAAAAAASDFSDMDDDIPF